jgi:hypothetical protein
MKNEVYPDVKQVALIRKHFLDAPVEELIIGQAIYCFDPMIVVCQSRGTFLLFIPEVRAEKKLTKCSTPKVLLLNCSESSSK